MLYPVKMIDLSHKSMLKRELEMQDIATTKSEIAALVTKVNDYSGNNFNQQQEFGSYLKQADRVYGYPDEPRKNHTAQENIKPVDDNQKNALREKSKDDSREYAKPVEQKSSNHAPQSSNTDNPQTSGSKDSLDSTVQDVQEQVSVSGQTNGLNSKHHSEQANGVEESKLNKAGDESELISAEQKDLENTVSTSLEQDSRNLDESVSEQGMVDEASLIDWLSLLEKSIAKATDGGEPQVKEEGELLDPSIAEKLSTDQSALESDEGIDLAAFNALLPTENSELVNDDVQSEVNITNSELETSSQETILASVDNLSNDESNKVERDDISLEQETKSTLETLTTLITELQAAFKASQQNTESGEAESLDQLLTRISEFVEQIDPKVMEKLQQSLTLESEAGAVSNNMLADTEMPTDNAITEDMQLLLDLLAVSNVTDATTKMPANSDTQPSDEQTITSQAQNITTIANQELTASGKQLDKSVRALLDIPSDKLDAALANLAQRLDVKPSTDQADTSGTSIKTDFISALKSGVEEVKAQIKQGHQPAIDLSTLVTDAATKVGAMPIVPEVLDQSVTRFNQSLELASQLNAKIEQLQHHFVSEKTLVKENINQAQHLQTKQGQQLAQFDKAVNITRNEGLQQLTEKVRWMANQNNLQAEIRLDPPDLGAMKVRLNMSGDTASVNIVVQSQQARDVLEQATPRLKELLEQQGIELGQSSVQQEQNDKGQQDSEYVGTHQAEENMQGEESQVIEQRISHGRLGGIDYFV
ncbi:flagellar hook-length control protein FliK [Aliiglaciecola sp. NS0011-25]|uniref:flagellar hook-length control protein FliK n=1 Tax=Aliiglaciecola sp. NS0011-25 TaxID=3127654 RepID=UPI003342A52F